MRFGKIELIAFFSGMAVMIIEIGGARIIAPYLGNTLFTWTSAIAVILGSLSVGYYFGGKVADIKPEIKTLSWILFAAAILTGIIPLVSSIVLQGSLVFGLEYGPLFACICLLAIPNVFLGMVSPYAVRLKTRKVKVIGESAGNLYAISTTGSIIGALMTGYILIPYVGVRESFFLTSVILAIMGIIGYGKKGVPFLILVIAFAFIPQGSATNIYGFHVIYQTDTPYYHLEVANISGNLSIITDLSVQSIIYKNYSDAPDYYKYQELIYDGTPHVQKALYLGLGGGSMVTDLYKNTNASIDIVEIDPGVIKVAAEYFNITPNSRVRIYNQDARFFLRNNSNTYNMIVLDAYGSSLSMAYQLTTVEAATEIKDHLAANGSVFINIISPMEGNDSAVFKSLYLTYNSVFPNLYVFPQEPQNLTRIQNIEIIASVNKTRYSEQDFYNELNRSVGKNQTVALLKDYYQGPINTMGYSILTDDKNPYDVYAAEAVSQIIRT